MESASKQQTPKPVLQLALCTEDLSMPLYPNFDTSHISCKQGSKSAKVAYQIAVVYKTEAETLLFLIQILSRIYNSLKSWKKLQWM